MYDTSGIEAEADTCLHVDDFDFSDREQTRGKKHIFTREVTT